MAVRRMKKLAKKTKNEDFGNFEPNKEPRATTSNTQRLAMAMVNATRFRSLLHRLLKDEMLVDELVKMIEPGIKDVLIEALKHIDVKISGSLASRAKRELRTAVRSF